MTIPIANIYYLLLYAWRHADRRDLVDVGQAGKSDLLNLLAHVFCLETRRLLSRGLAREYSPLAAVVGGVRGKVDIGVTLKRNLLCNARTWCEFDELSYDIPRNQIIKGALRLLLKMPSLDGDNRNAARSLYRKMDMVSDTGLSRASFRAVQSHRLVRDYSFALRLARLLSERVILDEAGDVTRFVDFADDEATMHKLFEDFVFNFYKLEYPQWHAQRKQIDWFDAKGTSEALQRLPGMHTDVYLSAGSRHYVLDAKFYSKPLDGRFGDRVRSENLYQLYSYVDNAASALPEGEVEGILLYAATDTHFKFQYHLNGRRFRVLSLDLTQNWRLIHQDLVSLLNEEVQ